MRIFKWIGIAFVAITLLGTIGRLLESPEDSAAREARYEKRQQEAAPETGESTAARKLAVIDLGKADVTSDDVDPYERVLTTLDAKCRESIEDLGGLSQVGVEKLAASGVPTNRLGFLQAVDKAHEILSRHGNPDPNGDNCGQIALAVVAFGGEVE